VKDFVRFHAAASKGKIKEKIPPTNARRLPRSLRIYLSITIFSSGRGRGRGGIRLCTVSDEEAPSEQVKDEYKDFIEGGRILQAPANLFVWWNGQSHGAPDGLRPPLDPHHKLRM
jgi:hypothetical protein